ncbi:hypothetical protein FACS189494_02900 [Spirochaetia bacterium]|nr:hypothetical protein FACS189494_02900 [Spirochaetia bacterium]
MAVNAACEKAQGKLPVSAITFLTKSGETVVVEAEVARTDEERNMGLMWRKSLSDGKGMLFVYDRDRIMAFWMKNTLIPLSIAFMAKDGTVLEIHDMQPQSTMSIKSARSMRYALEVPQGWFKRAGVSVGSKAGIP